VLIGALALVAAGGIGTALWLATRPEPQPVVARFPMHLPDSVRLFGGGGTKLAITRDGRAILKVGGKNGSKGLYIRRIDDPVAQLVRGTEAGTGTFNVSPRFAFDGQWIAFVTQDRILRKGPCTRRRAADPRRFRWGIVRLGRWRSVGVRAQQ